jgi:thioredoxin reductase (NADPH)
MFLSQFASRVTLIVRGKDLRQTMSAYLLDRVLANDKIGIRYGTNVVAVDGSEYIEAVSLQNEKDETIREKTCGLFIFIGSRPKTEFFPPSIAKDAKGFILTGPGVEDLPTWNQTRPPCSLETSVPGIFACGDCRSAPTKRISFAIADGAVAAACVDSFLNTNT